MDKILKLYTYEESSTSGIPFPNDDEQIIISNFTYDAGRMSAAPTISATVKHRLCLDDLWNDKVYAEFRGEKYFIMNTPSSSKDNEDERYEHDIELLSEREVLNHVYFIDAVQGDSTVDVYKSNSTKVIFFGDVNEFVGRLNACLSYQKLDYTAVVDEGVTSKEAQVYFEDKYILEALQEIFNVYEIPYYFVGKVIHVGYTENTITYPLKYGFDEALLSISKENANYAVINKIKGQGSSDNIPYYYPNNSPKGDIKIKITSGTMTADDFIIEDYVKLSSSMSFTDVCSVRSVVVGEVSSEFVWSINDNDIELEEIGIRLADGVVPVPNSSFMLEQVSYITPMPNLMPSIYRESLGAEQFYEAKNNTYEDGEGGYYEFENEYSDTNQRQGTTDFEDIKPTIEGMTNASGQRIDMFSAFAYDKNDNDEVDEEGKYVHTYFFAKLRKFDGENGFNLFDHAIESQAMQISFTSGVCGACTFEIGVGDETQKNIVQVDEFGNLKRDAEGNVLWRDQTPQDRQNDTRNYEVWIALKKDDSTYGIVFPNASQNLKPSTSDTFVILGIDLPTAYITAAEKRLEQSLIKYMWINNKEKFTFSIKFSRIFFTEHPEVLEQLNENSRVLIEYNGQQHTLYVDNFSYKTDDSSPLPEIEIDLVDTLSVGQNSLQTQLDSVKQDILSSIGGGDFLKQGLKYFLRKDVSDTARKKITFREGIDVGAFEGDISGGTFRTLQDGTTYAELDKIKVRVKAYFETLEIQNINSVGGKQIITPGGGVYVKEVVDRETVDGTEVVWDYYRCYFLTQQDGREIENRFKVGDLAISQNFNVKEGTYSDISNHYYWREVVGVGTNYIDLSKSICDTGSDAPVAEDVICQLGNRTDIDRQGAIIFSAVDEFSPSITLYQGINDFSYVGKDYVSYGLDKTTGKSFFRVYGEMYVGDREQNTYIKYTQDNGVEIKGKLVTQTGKDVESTLNSFQDQIDGVKETFYGEYSPTLENYPANEWTTEADKERHIGDVFTNIQAYVDEETTPDAGKSWRWMKNEDDGTYYWLQIADSDTSKAYLEAAKANQAAQEAKQQVTELNTTVDGLQNFTDESFKDGIVDRSEASSISTYLNNIKSIQNSVTESYNKVYNNELLEGTDKTNLLNAYTAFNNATNELVTTIEGAIADGLVDTLEKASVDGKYDAFNTKYGDFIAYINAANNYIQDKINASAQDALDKIGKMSYITDALKQYTTIEGGLIQSSLLALGYTDSDGFKVMSGTNGIYDTNSLGGGIASWWGGGMYDRFEYTEGTMPSDVATGLVRFDGTGYFANGNLWWEADGTLHADPLSFFVGEDAVGDILGLFQFIKSEGISRYVIPQLPFQKLEIANDLKIGKGYLKWDEENNAIYVVGEDGSKCNFYALGGLAAKGYTGSESGGTGGASYLSDLLDVNLTDLATDDMLKWDGNKWINIPMSTITPDLSWGNITGKPSWIGDTKPSYTFAEITSKPTTIAGYGITDGVSSVSVTGSGNVITSITKSGTKITATKGITALTSVSISTISDLNSTWDSLLKNSKPTTLSGYGITDAYTKTDSDSRYVKKSGDTMSGTLYMPHTLVGISETDANKYAGSNTYYNLAIGWKEMNRGFGILFYRPDSTKQTGIAFSTTDSDHVDIFLEANSNDLTINNLKGGVNIKGTTNTGLVYNSNTVWHEGNDGAGSGLDADLLDGLDGDKYQKALYEYIPSDLTAAETTLLPNILAHGTGISGYRFIDTKFYTSVSQTSNRTQVAYGYSSDIISFRRYYNGSWLDWKTIAFTDDNVASATKLQTPRTIWGQSFDGTANITGALSGVTTITASDTITGKYFMTAYGSGNRKIRLTAAGLEFHAATGGWANGLGICDNSGAYLNQDIGGVYGDASTINYLFYGGTYNSPIMVIKPSNKYVGIGTTSPSYKLHVAGGFGVQNYGKTITIYSENASWCHYRTDATNGHWFGNNVTIQGNLESYGGTKNLGSNSARWNVWAGTGNFSGAVTMSSTLNVAGLVTVTGSSFTGASHFGVGTRLYDGDSQSIEVAAGNYVMGLGCHSNGNWYWWRGNSGYSSTTGKSYVMRYDIADGTWNFTGTLYSSVGIYTEGYMTAKTTSDIRLKTILNKVDYQQKLLDLGSIVSFKYNDIALKRNIGAVDDKEHIGLIYQNAVKSNLVNFCHEDIDGFGSINYIASDYINLIAGACQLNILGLRTLSKRTETLEQRVARLEKENIELKQKLSAYEKSNPMVS